MRGLIAGLIMTLLISGCTGLGIDGQFVEVVNEEGPAVRWGPPRAAGCPPRGFSRHTLLHARIDSTPRRAREQPERH